MDAKFKKLWDISKEYLKNGREVDLPHTRVSLDFALRLIREEGGDNDVITPAVILHDIGYSQIQEKDLYKKTTYYSVYAKRKSNEAYSSQLKELHLVEGARLARKILESVQYETHLIDKIVDIVRYHEDVFARPPSDVKELNKIIVSDADKLFRFTPFNFFDIIKIHAASVEEVFQYILDMRDTWLVTKSAQLIAEEEIRKIPDSYLFSGLFE